MFGGLDAIVFTSAVVPFALIEDTDVTTWLHAYAVNAVGASHVLRSALPHLTDNAVALFASVTTSAAPAPASPPTMPAKPHSTRFCGPGVPNTLNFP